MVTCEKPDFDVGIIGGGPAGASMASYLAMAGVNCVVFERELFPRPHVGESLVPASTRVFKAIGFLPKIEENNFSRKYGAVWTSAQTAKVYDHDWGGLEPDCQASVRFEEREQPGVDQNYTYHVDRGKFDMLLLQHASELGANVCEGVRVSDVDFSQEPYPEIKCAIGGKEFGVKVRMVADASGRRTLLGTRMKMKVMDPVFNQYALHTWFDGYRRGECDPDKADHIFIHFLPISNSWVWQIPITETVTSIGVVTQKKRIAKNRQSREQFFWNSAASRPEILENLNQARQLRPLKEEGDYSYAMTHLTGNRFVLIGDAGRFVDPIFSSGVSIALNSARLASTDILRALDTGDFSRKGFANYEAVQRRGIKNWYEFITMYYRLNILFTLFLMDPRYRLDILKLLQGDVYDEEEPEVLAKMKQIVTAVEQNKNHVWHDLLGDLTADAFKGLSY
jgi:FADH2 O2-dependent halogenase